MATKVYTKTGDKGKTALFGGGEKVYKYDCRVAAYGQVDELNSFVGMLREKVDIDSQKVILKIQDMLFSIGAHLATAKNYKGKLPSLNNDFVKFLENEIDKMDLELPDLKAFVYPGGSDSVSWCHICRSVCRRAERAVVNLANKEHVNNQILIILNRLSDYFFILSRFVAKAFKTQEIPWKGN